MKSIMTLAAALLCSAALPITAQAHADQRTSATSPPSAHSAAGSAQLQRGSNNIVG